MDMKNILQNMDAAASGDKPSADTKDVNSMKTILESIQECGSPMMAGQEMPMASEGGQPVTVSITASGKDNVSDLIAMMQMLLALHRWVQQLQMNQKCYQHQMAMTKKWTWLL